MLTLEFLEESELNTILATNSRLKGVYDNFPPIIEVVLMLPYYTGKLDNHETFIRGIHSDKIF